MINLLKTIWSDEDNIKPLVDQNEMVTFKTFIRSVDSCVDMAQLETCVNWLDSLQLKPETKDFLLDYINVQSRDF